MREPRFSAVSFLMRPAFFYSSDSLRFNPSKCFLEGSLLFFNFNDLPLIDADPER
jgi:hypothetical protein